MVLQEFNMSVLDVILIVVFVAFAATIGNFLFDIRRNKSDSMSFKEAMDLVELPVITFYNGNTKLNFLLDTGSNKNIINNVVLESLNYKKIDEDGIPVIGFNGTASIAESIEMDFNYKDKIYSSNFQVLDMQEAFSQVKAETGVQIHGILGSLFFQEYGYVLDFESLVAYSKK